MNLRTLLLTSGAVFAGLLGPAGPDTVAQQPSTPYNLLMTREQAEGLITAWNAQLSYVPGEVLVKFQPGTDSGTQARALSVLRRGPQVAETRWISDVLLVRQSEEQNSETAAVLLERQPEVLWAQANYLRPLQTAPNDPSYTRQWNFDLIEMPKAWDINPGSNADITVAVVDSGVTTVTSTVPFTLWTGRRFEVVGIPFRINPDIAGARIAAGRDFVFWDGPVLDLFGHGTHVAGTILQETNNGIGLAGIAYNARLLPLKACFGYWDIQLTLSALGIPGFVDPREGGGCSDAAVAQAVRYAADAGAEVINLSFGGPRPAPILLEAIRYAVSKGSFVAIAIGNEFEEGNPVDFPAAYAAQIDGAVAVGAVGRSTRRAYYSNTGSHIELVAPGGDIRDGGVPGLIFQTGLLQDDFNPQAVIAPRFDRYVEDPHEGTSMAAPHVAGLAALLHSQGINRPAGIEAAMKRFARDLGAQGRDNEYGFGLIDARATLRGLGVAR